jgi:Flp pilus assembly protein TadG
VIQRRERAQGLVELSIILPGVMLALMILVGLGVVLRADGSVAGVAVEAARSAALATDATAAKKVATDEAALVGRGYGLSNGSLTLATVDTSNFRRGGDVRVVVTYVLPLGQIPMVGWQTITLQHEGFAPVDPNRTFR